MPFFELRNFENIGTMELLLVFIVGLVLGALIMWYLVRKTGLNRSSITTEELNERYIAREIYDSAKSSIDTKEYQIIELNKTVARTDQDNINLRQIIENQGKEAVKMEARLRTEFENLSNQLLDEKSKKFIALNEKNMGDILTPLKERILAFEKKVDETHKEDIRERVSLKTELEHILKLNQQMSEDANKLTSALKGNSKTQGDWGEMQLEQILQYTGLENGIHYKKQPSLKDEDGNNLRPDFIINLPDNKHIIVDSKVSLTAYEMFFNVEKEADNSKFLKEHISSILRHIQQLGDKNYHQLYGVNTIDYILMFIPVEPALYVALKEDSTLFEKAMRNNIVLVTGTTLLATLRTISFIWKQEDQTRNAADIARESGKLYDKFVGFMQDLTNVGEKLDGAKDAWHSAFNKLSQSKKQGDTIIGRIERIRKMGVPTTKSIPEQFTVGFDEDEQIKELE